MSQKLQPVPGLHERVVGQLAKVVTKVSFWNRWKSSFQQLFMGSLLWNFLVADQELSVK